MTIDTAQRQLLMSVSRRLNGHVAGMDRIVLDAKTLQEWVEQATTSEDVGMRVMAIQEALKQTHADDTTAEHFLRFPVRAAYEYLTA